MFSGIQQALILALMMVSVFSLFYIDIDLTYKIGIGVFAFTVIFLMTLATQILRQQKEENQQAQR